MEKKHNIDKFQGYPHYPPSEDITRAENNNGKERLDEEKTPPTPPFNDTTDERDKDVSIAPGTEADVTPEDLRALETSEQNMDSADSRNLIGSSLDDTDNDGDLLNVDGSLIDDVAGGDLDVPGSSDDDADELIGEEDEENNFYSLGGENHEGQEENKGE